MKEQKRIQCKNWKQFFNVCKHLKIPKKYWDDTEIENQKPDIKNNSIVLVIMNEYQTNDKDKWMYCEGSCEQCKKDNNVINFECLEEDYELVCASIFLRKDKLERILK